MPLEQYREIATTIREHRYLDEYETITLDWIHEYPGMTSAQIFVWLREHYEIDVTERTEAAM